jgi:hypothetical protein
MNFVQNFCKYSGLGFNLETDIYLRFHFNFSDMYKLKWKWGEECEQSKNSNFLKMPYKCGKYIRR